MPRRAACATAKALILCVALGRVSLAQVARDSGVDWLTSANSESEQYLRAAQVAGKVAPYPWSLRGFSTAELSALVPATDDHAWSRQFAATSSARWRVFAPDATLIYNSGFPFGENDGALWAGRGMTSALALGARVARGPFEVQLAPIVFVTQNSGPPLAPNGEQGALVYANAESPRLIDLPQRFGASAYGRFDLGQTTARVSGFGVTGGASTANEFWGPAARNPFVLGNNAAGFAHAFLGTEHPVGVGGVMIHARAIAGKLRQSDYSSTPMVGRGRYISGLVGVVTFSQLPGLELGGARVFQNLYADSAFSVGKLVRPLVQNFLKGHRASTVGTIEADEPDNQIASAFARWLFPGSHLEVYGEFGKEDSAYDLRDFLSEPDHDSSFLLGLQKTSTPTPRGFVSLRAEVFNARMTHLDSVRYQSPAYIHSPITQGHTNLGQLLAAPDGFGGAGELIAIDAYSSTGRRSLEYTKGARAQPSRLQRSRGETLDVVHALKAEQLSFYRGMDFQRSVTVAYEFNRDFAQDAVNVRFAAGLRAHW